MKIFVDENIPQGLEAFASHGEIILFHGRKLTQNDLKHADALIVRSITKIKTELLEDSPIRFVGTATIGTDHVDQNYLAQKGIGFSSAPGCNANSVAEYVLSALCRLQLNHDFAWRSKTLGIVGHGHVGKKLAAKAKILGLKTLLCDPPLQALQAQHSLSKNQESYFPLETLLQECDILSLHVPLTRSGPYPTYQMLNAQSLALIKKPLTLFNSCRGEVIEEKSLLQAKRDGKIQYLILDVFENEPNINPLLCSQTTFVTPHIAGYSIHGKLNGTQQIASAFCQFFNLRNDFKPVFPVPPQPIIEYGTNKMQALQNNFGQDFLVQCILSTYDIAHDDIALRLALQGENPGNAFDELRKKYPVRPEFCDLAIQNLPLENTHLHQILSALGFKIL